MKKYILLFMVAWLGVSCNGQNNKTEKKDADKNLVNKPKGSWKVDKAFDENGNLIKYDSIYSYTSINKIDDFSALDRDSIIQDFNSRFLSNFSLLDNQRFDSIFAQDSLFTKHFFYDTFFKNYTNLDNLRQEIISGHKKR
ncbi:hypothetical protein GCM10022291_32240 [Postechiella marina]|uniref:Lipoprotein n=1 Tax=Postechiella marina TaxID=943941 RepID=A0ABP8CGW9_9FLAO